MRRDTDPTGAERLSNLRYPRVLLKLSGEALAGEKGFAWDFAIVERLAGEVASVVQAGACVGLVIGGGNLVRGRLLSESEKVDRVTGDYMGMLATVINALAI